ncbi:DUF1501 domain-containing protein [Planctomicrobium piriforme]|uniref:Tat (Twin-arginine translocation) pathway signal sequence n=1 Tax=Planctomicrobium piriforme TaxID=1576369 RepID=A0A1I3F4B9_9PLAN|nr:DUF1501 domain-containing protein [Planctomicrobium piriforme]SFI06057.1 Protein of unknown function [Planctomicrobium piriforme]
MSSSIKLSRRDLMRLLAAGYSATSLSGWLPLLARAHAAEIEKPRTCILLWMPGGPSQLDTFDPKPGHENGGEFAAIDTSVSGIQICEHLPQLARHMDQIALIRSMKTKEGDHSRATYHLRTGYRPGGPIQYPALGSLVANEYRELPGDLPHYVSILSDPFLNPAAYASGFLGPQFAPLQVGNSRGNRNAPASEYGAPLEVRDIALAPGISLERNLERMQLLEFTDGQFAKDRTGLPTASHAAAYQQAYRMMQSPAMKAFRLEEEPATIRDAYGKNRFGQACLLARRLVEVGVPFIEVALNGVDGGQLGWDTHQQNFASVKGLCQVLDAGCAALLSDLKGRGLLETTTIIWMGEFGRTPIINGMGGRDHFPNAWSVFLAGGGIRGGQVYGSTTEAGTEIKDSPVAVNQLFATILSALGLDPKKQNLSDVGRPIRLAEPEVEPIQQLLV